MAPGRPGRRLRLAQVILSYCFLIKFLLEVVDFRFPVAPGRSADLQLCKSADLQLCKSADLESCNQKGGLEWMKKGARNGSKRWSEMYKKSAWNGSKREPEIHKKGSLKLIKNGTRNGSKREPQIRICGLTFFGYRWGAFSPGVFKFFVPTFRTKAGPKNRDNKLLK